MCHNKNLKNRIKNKWMLFISGFVAQAILMILAVTAATAFGDVTAAGAKENVNAKDVNPDPCDRGGVKVSSGEDIAAGETVQSITFDKDMTIKDGLRVLSAMYKKNIVPSAKIDGVMGFTRLYNVTFEEAMDAILGGKFEYEQNGNLIEVYPTGDVSRMKYEVFPLHYITAAEAKKLIEPVLSKNGTVGVTSPAETGVPTGESISAPKGGGDTMSLRDTIVVYDFAENIKKAKEVISAIDVRPQQVLIEATILSATLTEDTQFGIDWQTLKGTAVTALTGITQGSPDYYKSVGTQLGGATAITGGLTVGLAIGDVASFIRAVEQVTDVTILANPKILAVNKQLGTVYIGDKIGYNSQTTVAESGTSTSQVSFMDTGTKLSFRPYISTDGYIRLDLHAKNSKQTSGGVISETSTELVSNIMVKDGQTVVIGGLFQDTIDTRKSQVPLLGDLPIAGAIFRGTADQSVRKEVIVLLTPHTIEEPSETEGQARMDDIHNKRFGAKEELQWVGRARLVEDNYAKAVEYYLEGNNEAALNKLNWILEMRPTYLEALRLKERIIRETVPDGAATMERVMLDVIEKEESSKWLRR
jgi:type IV pilus assembly protein PilQ